MIIMRFAYTAILNRKEMTTSDASKNFIPLYEALPFMECDEIEKYENKGWKKYPAS